MPKTIVAKALTQTQFTYQETVGQQTRTDADLTQNSCDYTYGTGNFQVTAILKATGHIPSGSRVEINLAQFPVNMLSVVTSGAFSKFKNITVANTSTASSGIDINIRATGSAGVSGLFNGGSGNLLIKPYGSFFYNDPYAGIDISVNSRLQLHNMSPTSGVCTYAITVMGII